MGLAPEASAPPPTWLCSRCGYKPFTGNPGSIAAHLVEEHGVPAMAALREARRPAETPPPTAATDTAPAPPTTTKETPMPTGVYARKSDPTKPCGSCKRPKDDHRPGCPRNKSAPADDARATRPKPAATSRRGRPKKVPGTHRVATPTAAAPVAPAHTDVLFRSAADVIQVLAPLSQDQRGRVLKAVEMLLPLA